MNSGDSELARMTPPPASASLRKPLGMSESEALHPCNGGENPVSEVDVRMN